MYTKGPWRAALGALHKDHDIHGAGEDFYPDGFIIARVVHSNALDDKGAEGEANARLIASAPELLEALEAIAGYPHADHPGLPLNQCRIKARAAIAKAKEG